MESKKLINEKSVLSKSNRRKYLKISFFPVLAFLVVFFLRFFLPLPAALTEPSKPFLVQIFDSKGKIIYQNSPDETAVSKLSISELPQHLIEAVLSAEDKNFYNHFGIDLAAVFRAFYDNLIAGRVVSGASTIDQQLVRNLLNKHNNELSKRTFLQKTKEAFLTFRFSQTKNKDEIMEDYLNTVYFGNLNYGIEAAARNYLGKSAKVLDTAESAFLIGLTQAPNAYNPFKNFAKTKARQEQILAQMLENDFIDEIEYAAFLQQKILLRGLNQSGDFAPHFVRMILGEVDELIADLPSEIEGIRIYTSLNSQMQTQAERIIAHNLGLLTEKNASNAALLALDTKTAEVLAWVGSADFENESIAGQFDVLLSLRQPGSALKPFTYLAAFEKNWTPATLIFDIPTEFNSPFGAYAPRNYDFKFRGPVLARIALASSLNVPAVKTLEYVGVENFLGFLRKFGIESLNQSAGHYGLALTLGGGEVSPYELARAYLALANFGDYQALRPIREIRDLKGTLLKDFPQKKSMILGKKGRAHAWQIIDILSDNAARIAGFGSDSALRLSHRTAVKTGTTRNYKDNWTVGFNTDLLTLVWVGNSDASSMRNISGVSGAAPIWRDFMETFSNFGMGHRDFPKPKNLVKKQICLISGKLTHENCPNSYEEFFVTGTQPQEKDNFYQKVKISLDGETLITDECLAANPTWQYVEKVYLDLPPALDVWAKEQNLQQIPQKRCDENLLGHDELLIISPFDGAKYLIDPEIPRTKQKLNFRLSSSINKVSWYLNGKKISVEETENSEFSWALEKGVFTLFALDEKENKSNEVRFEVVGK
jgi:penicillin-binding protein 1C